MTLIKFKAVITKDLLAKIGFAVLSITIVFDDLVSMVLPGILRYALWLFAVVCLICPALDSDKFILKINPIRKITLWLIFVPIFVLLRNKLLLFKGAYTTIRWLYLFSLVLIIPLSPKRLYKSYIKILGGCTFITMFFALFFFFFKGKYSIMKGIWGYWPTGTENGTLGYRAGITSHYSINAMVLAVGLIVFTSFLIANWNKKNKINVLIIGLFLLTILLTTKRAHLLFGFLAILVGLFLHKPEDRKKNFFKITFAALLIVILFIIMAKFVPIIGQVYERFTNAGEDNETKTRFNMWKLAIDNFLEHPIVGLGWGGFPLEFNEHLYNPAVWEERYAFLHAHNVYFQILCECGIIGTFLFFGNALYLYKETVVLFKRKLNHTNDYCVAIFSVMMQTFFYLYCATGNCLYDIMFGYFTIAIGLSIGLYTQKNII